MELAGVRNDVAFACDTDADRHGVVSRSAGLLNPNQYLSVAIAYLFAGRTGWPAILSSLKSRSGGS